MRSQNCEKRLLTSLCLSVRLSVRIEQLGSHWTCFWWNLTYEFFFSKIRQENSIFIKIRQELQALHIMMFSHLWQRLTELFLECETLQIDVVEKITVHILYSITFSENRAVYEILWKNIVEPERSQMAIWRLVAYWIIKATSALARAQAPVPTPMRTHASSRASTHTEKYVVLIAFPWQHWFRESASSLRYKYIPATILYH